MRCSLSRSKPPRCRKRGGENESQPTRPMGRSSPSYLLSPKSNSGRGISISNAVPKRRSGREDSVEEPGACSLLRMLLLQQGKKKKSGDDGGGEETSRGCWWWCCRQSDFQAS